MPSLRALLFNMYLKRNVKPRPLHLIDPAILRENADDVSPDKPPRDVACEEISMNGVRAERQSYAKSDNQRSILYFHGGGYVFGSPKYARRLTCEFAKRAEAEVYSVDYRLAPENEFPAAVEDAVAAYRWLLDQGRDPSKIIFSGDSAGGGLCLALMISCKEHDLPMPAGGVLFSPFTDLAATSQSLVFNENSDAMFKKIYISEGAKRYLGSADPKSPLASPLYGNHDGLPSILSFVSDKEVLYNDATRLHEKLAAAGVEEQLITEKGLAHVWPIFFPQFPEAGKTIRQAADFVMEKTA